MPNYVLNCVPICLRSLGVLKDGWGLVANVSQQVGKMFGADESHSYKVKLSGF